MKIWCNFKSRLLDISYSPWTPWVLMLGLVTSLIVGPVFPRPQLSMGPIQIGTRVATTEVLGPLAAKNTVRVYDATPTYYASLVATSLVADTTMTLSGHAALPRLSGACFTNVTLNAGGSNEFSFASSLPNTSYIVLGTYTTFHADPVEIVVSNKTTSGFVLLGQPSQSADLAIFMK